MDTKQFFISVSFAIVTTMLINYFIIDRFFSKDTQEIKTGQAFYVMPSEHMNKPLMTEVNFLDEDILFFSENKADDIEISTPYSTVTFSSQGGTITNVICKKISGNVEDPFRIISSDHASLAHPFLLAFQDNTPLQYVLTEKKYENGVHSIEYESDTAIGIVRKRFKVFDDSYMIDMEITIDPRLGAANPLTPRIIFPGPRLAESSKGYDIALVNNQQGGIQRLKFSDLSDKAFALPTLCGGADRYFVNAYIKSSIPFAQRCYFVTKNNALECIIEGPEVVRATTWNLSWYCGPKEFEPLQKSDMRLTELLDYGWFTPLARSLLFILKQLYAMVHNFGLAIIILTVILNLLLLPFTTQGEKVLQKTADLNKKLQYLEQKYKHDKDLLSEEKSKLMQKHGVMDSLGCMSFLLQTVFFIGLNKVLSSSIELYHAPFYGWITDLSVADPYYILPLCVFLGIIIPVFENSASGRAGNDIRQKATTIGIGLLICGIVAQLSAGLVLFILTNIFTRVAITRIKKMIF